MDSLYFYFDEAFESEFDSVREKIDEDLAQSLFVEADLVSNIILKIN